MTNTSKPTEPSPNNFAGPPPCLPSVKDYDIIRRIGGGGFGTVYLAHDLTGSPCALKVVRHSDTGSDYAYTREYESVCEYMPLSGKNPNLIEVRHIGKEDGFFYYTMPIADDEQGRAYDPETYRPKTLRSLMPAPGKAMSIKRAIEAVLPVLDALEFLHNAEPPRFHRDIKPDNIVFIDCRPVLGDIGIMTELKPDMTRVLTPEYSPKDGVVDAAGDLYSVGMILFEASGGNVRRGYIYLPTVQVGRCQPLFSSVSTVIDKAHSLKYKSAKAMKADLEKILEGDKSGTGRSSTQAPAVSRTASQQNLKPAKASGSARASTTTAKRSVRRPRPTAKPGAGSEIVITIPVPDPIVKARDTTLTVIKKAKDAVIVEAPVVVESVVTKAENMRDVAIDESRRAKKEVVKTSKRLLRQATKTGNQVLKSAQRDLKKIKRWLPF